MSEASLISIFLLNKITFSSNVMYVFTALWIQCNSISYRGRLTSIHKIREHVKGMCSGNTAAMWALSKVSLQHSTEPHITPYTTEHGSGQTASIICVNTNYSVPGAQEQSITPWLFSRTFKKRFFKDTVIITNRLIFFISIYSTGTQVVAYWSISQKKGFGLYICK